MYNSLTSFVCIWQTFAWARVHARDLRYTHWCPGYNYISTLPRKNQGNMLGQQTVAAVAVGWTIALYHSVPYLLVSPCVLNHTLLQCLSLKHQHAFVHQFTKHHDMRYQYKYCIFACICQFNHHNGVLIQRVTSGQTLSRMDKPIVRIMQSDQLPKPEQPFDAARWCD